MKKIALAAAILASGLLAFAPSHATTYTAQYVAAGLYPTGVITSPTPGALTTFPAGKTPVSIKVVDAANLKNFSVDVCQNVNTGNANCAAGDIFVSYCSTGQTKTLTGFSAAHATSVYVNPDDATALLPCSGDPTVTGTITFITT